MGDFLSNLVAKNLNRAPLLEPRPRSQFEAWPRLGVSEFLSPIDDTALEVSATRDAPSPSARRPDDDPIQSTPREPTVRAPKRQSDDSRAPVGSKTVEVKPSVAPQGISPLPQPPVLTTNRRPVQLEVDTSRASVQPRVERFLTETSRVERVIVENERRKAVSDLPARHQLTAEPSRTKPLSTPSSESSSRKRTEPPDSPVAAPPTLLPRFVPQLTREARAEPVPETINVTIGRIEVRAITNRPAPKATRATQVSTLDDYLRRSSKR